jgi:hypothetical protein
VSYASRTEADATGSGLGPVATDFRSPGPLSTRFLNSVSPIVIVMGPVGSAKSSTAFMKAFENVRRQPRNLQTGFKEIKTTVVVDTYKNLHNKVLVTFADIIPRNCPFAKWIGGKGEDVEVKFWWHDDEGQQYFMWWHFLAVGDRNIESITGGLLTTDVYLYECDKLPIDVVNEFYKRLLRWPDANNFAEGEYIQSQLYGEMNAPNDTHPLYRRLAYGAKATDEFIIYPSGLSPDAENLENLMKRSPTFYEDQMAGMDDPDMIARMIENRVGYSHAGKPVYRDYAHDLHCAKREMKPSSDLPLILCVDGGGQAAAAVLEPTKFGHLNILHEIVTPDGEFTDATTFGERCAREIGLKFPGRAVIGVCDPANTLRSATAQDAQSWIRLFIKASKIFCVPAPTNRTGMKSPNGATPDTRIGSVRKLLRRLVDGRPALMVNASCVYVREGFTSGYSLKKIRSIDGVTYRDEPTKNIYSHIHDAIQYGCLFFLNGGEMMQEAMRQSVQVHNPAAFHGQSGPKIIARN